MAASRVTGKLAGWTEAEVQVAVDGEAWTAVRQVVGDLTSGRIIDQTPALPASGIWRTDGQNGDELPPARDEGLTGGRGEPGVSS